MIHIFFLLNSLSIIFLLKETTEFSTCHLFSFITQTRYLKKINFLQASKNINDPYN